MLLDLAQKHSTLKKVSTREWAGPCPLCGGNDRFRVWPEKGNGGQWWCRRCNQGGDVLQFLRKVEGMSCPDAHVALGRECTSTTCEVRDRCRLGESRQSHVKRLWPGRDTPKAVQEKRRSFTPEPAADPADTWRGKALALVTWAHDQLLTHGDQLDQLRRRGITLDAVQSFGLGWMPEDLYRSREKWGLREEISDKTGHKKRLWIP